MWIALSLGVDTHPVLSENIKGNAASSKSWKRAPSLLGRGRRGSSTLHFNGFYEPTCVHTKPTAGWGTSADAHSPWGSIVPQSTDVFGFPSPLRG